MSDELFDSVDALLVAVESGTVLPVPAERVRLREAAGLAVAAVAQALKTARLAGVLGERTHRADRRQAGGVPAPARRPGCEVPRRPRPVPDPGSRAE